MWRARVATSTGQVAQRRTMTYQLGIDLGTTFTAAAVARNGHVEVVGLGSRASSVPSVLYVPAEGGLVVGEAAERHAGSDPGRVAREFKRRMGDPTPLLLGGTPYSPEALTARLLAWVVAKVNELEGGPAQRVAVTHPANWGRYKQELLADAVRMAGLDRAHMLSEPMAAAICYATNERVAIGSLLAVYDLGGGTFDAAVLRKTGQGFELLGSPEGIEHLGGLDLDQAVFAHVRGVLGAQLDRLDLDDPATLRAVNHLRSECVAAKEALSVDTETCVPVVLPGLQDEVRLTRGEFEHLVRPALEDTIAALQRALASAEVAASEISVVLLVGGSSRVPLVAELVSDALRRPVAIDAHPKHVVAAGAAHAATIAAASAARGAPTTRSRPATTGRPPPGVPVELRGAPLTRPLGSGPAPGSVAPAVTPGGAIGPRAEPVSVPSSTPARVEAFPGGEPPGPSTRRRAPLLAVGVAIGLVALLIAGVLLWGQLGESAEPPSATMHPSAISATTLSAGGEHSCGVRTDGFVVCWGNDRLGQSSPPEGLRPVSVSAGYWHTCALGHDGTAACWGWNEHGQSTPPFDEVFTTISAGGGHTCALRQDASPVCWGLDDHGQASPPSGLTLTAVTAGGEHSCGLHEDGTVTCWGNDLVGQASPPPGLSMLSLSAGDGHTCGVESDGLPRCWGDQALGMSRPDREQHVLAVDAGMQLTCALDVDGTARCWGNAQASGAGPGTQLRTVSVGGRDNRVHVCALAADGSPICWGADDEHQSSPPAGLVLRVPGPDAVRRPDPGPQPAPPVDARRPPTGQQPLAEADQRATVDGRVALASFLDHHAVAELSPRLE